MEQGAQVHKSGNRLIVRKMGQEIQSRLLFDVEQVVALGNVQFTAPTIHCLLQRGIDTVFLSKNGRFRGRLQSFEGKNVLLRRQQFRQADQPDFQLKLACSFAAGKIQNCRLLLRRQQQRLQLKTLEEALVRLKGSIHRLERAQDIDEVRGIEGNAAAIYFDCFGLMLTNPNMSFRGRNRRPPRDAPNAALSFGYGLLLGTLNTALYVAGLDPFVGALHAPDTGKPSLVLDLMEEFRPLLVDAMVVSAINRRQLTEDDFRYQEVPALPPGLEGEEPLQEDDYPVLLQPESIRKMIMLYEQGLKRTVTYPPLGNNLTFQQICLEQARLLARHYQGQEAYLPFTPR